MKQCIKNQKGYSLVEVIVSIALLSIVTIGLLRYFSYSLVTNATEQKGQQETILTQSIMEQCKDRSLSDMATLYPGGTSEVDGNKTYYKFNDVIHGSKKYDVRIVVDSTTTYGLVNSSSNLIDIQSVSSPKSVVAIESIQQENAVIAFATENTSYCATENMLHSGDASWTALVPDTKAQICSKLYKDIHVNFRPVSGRTDVIYVEISYWYYCIGLAGCSHDSPSNALEVTPYLYSNSVELSEFSKMHLFYNHIESSLNSENIIMSVDSAITGTIPEIQLYLICQSNSLGIVPVNEVDISKPSSILFSSISTNTDSVKVNGGSVPSLLQNLITTNSDTLISNIGVEIYEAGKNFDASALVSSMKSTVN